jgi:beta-glucosidase/6-phospho-beta-glucosidase/beta-galactosidase
MVTENGLADEADALRAGFVRDHVAAVARANRRGADVRGYLHWALIDNFEWVRGLAPRFGLYRVDYTDPARPRTRTQGAEALSGLIAAGEPR